MRHNSAGQTPALFESNLISQTAAQNQESVLIVEVRDAIEL